MKRYTILQTIAIICLLCSALSCKKLNEDQPLELINQNYVFNATDSIGTYTQQFLNSIYASLPQGYNRIGSNMLDAGTDDAVPNSVTDNVQYYSTGGINASVIPDNTWAADYAGIRKVNIFLSQIGRVKLQASMAGYKNRWIAEARCLRAMFYFELIKRWGGVPLVGDQVLDPGQNITIPRSSYTDCVNYIITELNTAMPNLLSANAAGTFSAGNYGRFSRGAAMALKARLLLYAASPLNNPTNDVTKWQAAAKAAKDIIDSVAAGNFTYKLNTTATTKHYTTTTLAGITTPANMAAYINSVNVFLSTFSTISNNEIILPYMAAPNTTVEFYNDPVGFPRGGQGKTNPTQELVNEFEMTNGKMITDSTSGYASTMPYYNRDPRFPATIMFDGLYWLNRPVQTFDGGLDRPLGYGRATSGETRTGYYLRKFMTSNGSSTAYANQNHVFPIMRYAEVLLNYAEAQNEAVGPDASVYAQINAIRARVGMPALPAGLSQADMRTRIRHERRVEMAFEEQRFWDIRRWKIAENVLNGTLHGVQGINNGSSVTYNVVSVMNTSFNASKMYLFPIPFYEIASDPAITQNPNW